MKKLEYSKTIYGDLPDERGYADFFKGFDGCDFDLSDNCLIISKNGQDLVKTSVSFLEEDQFDYSWKGFFSDGTPFRIVRHKELYQMLVGDFLAFGSKMRNGYAVHFYLR